MCGDGTNRRDYAYVDDVADGVAASLRRTYAVETPEYEIINLVGSETIELRDLVAGIGWALSPTRAASVAAGRREAHLRGYREGLALLGCRPETPIDEGLQVFARWVKAYYADRRVEA